MDTEGELLFFKNDAKRIMEKVKFDLRGWEYSGQEELETSTSVLGLN